MMSLRFFLGLGRVAKERALDPWGFLLWTEVQFIGAPCASRNLCFAGSNALYGDFDGPAQFAFSHAPVAPVTLFEPFGWRLAARMKHCA